MVNSGAGGSWRRVRRAWLRTLDFLYPVVNSTWNRLNATDERVRLQRAIMAFLALMFSYHGFRPFVVALVSNDDVRAILASIAIGIAGGVITFWGVTRQRRLQKGIGATLKDDRELRP